MDYAQLVSSQPAIPMMMKNATGTTMPYHNISFFEKFLPFSSLLISFFKKSFIILLF